MAAFSFKRRFVEPILDLTKTGTIRRERKGGWRPRVGMELQLYYGLRTRHVQLIGRAICAEVIDIVLDFRRSEVLRGIWIEVPAELDAFAVSDGFKSWEDMRQFWIVEHEDAPIFTGFHTTWTNLKPAWRDDHA